MVQPVTQLLSDWASDLAQQVTSSSLYCSLRCALHLLLACAQVVAGVLGSLEPWLRRPVDFAARLVQRAVETAVFFGSMLLLSGRALLLRKSLTTSCRMAVTMVTVYFLTPTIALVIESSKMNYHITKMLRQANMRVRHYLQMLVVLPLSFVHMFHLLSVLLDTFLATFKIFFNVMEVCFSYAILIFRAYKTFALCAASIMRSVYITSYFSIYLVHSGLGFLSAVTSLMQNSAVRRALVFYKEHKMRATGTSAR